jgi:hypothetical protein
VEVRPPVEAEADKLAIKQDVAAAQRGRDVREFRKLL